MNHKKETLDVFFGAIAIISVYLVPWLVIYVIIKSLLGE